MLIVHSGQGESGSEREKCSQRCRMSSQAAYLTLELLIITLEFNSILFLSRIKLSGASAVWSGARLNECMRNARRSFNQSQDRASDS